MKIISYIHPSRTFLPCSGVGRHVNNLLLAIDRREDIDLSLLYADQWLLKDCKLPPNAPLRELPFTSFPWSERLMERSWKALNWPKMDKYLDGADWMFSPVETRFPVKNIKTAITIHDVQAFETDLPWSHTKEHQQFKKRWVLWLGKALEQSDLVFTVSEFSRLRLIELFNLNPEKVKVSGNAVDPVFLGQADQITPKEADFPYLVVPGGLRPKKGGQEILKVARILKDAWPELKLVVWGENDSQLLEEAKQLPNMIIYPMISDEEMIAWTKGAFAALFLSWYEGFGIPVLESMACGVPVISSNKASLPEVAGNAAFLVAPDDTQKIYDCIIELKNPEKRLSLIKSGYENMQRYSWDKCAENVVQALAEFN